MNVIAVMFAAEKMFDGALMSWPFDFIYFSHLKIKQHRVRVQHVKRKRNDDKIDNEQRLVLVAVAVVHAIVDPFLKRFIGHSSFLISHCLL